MEGQTGRVPMNGGLQMAASTEAPMNSIEAIAVFDRLLLLSICWQRRFKNQNASFFDIGWGGTSDVATHL